MCKYKTSGYSGLFSLHIERPSYVLSHGTLTSIRTLVLHYGTHVIFSCVVSTLGRFSFGGFSLMFEVDRNS